MRRRMSDGQGVGKQRKYNGSVIVNNRAETEPSRIEPEIKNAPFHKGSWSEIAQERANEDQMIRQE